MTRNEVGSASADVDATSAGWSLKICWNSRYLGRPCLTNWNWATSSSDSSTWRTAAICSGVASTVMNTSSSTPLAQRPRPRIPSTEVRRLTADRVEVGPRPHGCCSSDGFAEIRHVGTRAEVDDEGTGVGARDVGGRMVPRACRRRPRPQRCKRRRSVCSRGQRARHRRHRRAGRSRARRA